MTTIASSLSSSNLHLPKKKTETVIPWIYRLYRRSKTCQWDSVTRERKNVRDSTACVTQRFSSTCVTRIWMVSEVEWRTPFGRSSVLAWGDEYNELRPFCAMLMLCSAFWMNLLSWTVLWKQDVIGMQLVTWWTRRMIEVIDVCGWLNNQC